MRYENFEKNEYYHLSCTGNTPGLFLDDEDRARFVFLLTHFQSPIRVYNTGWYASRFLKKGSFFTDTNKTEQIVKKRNVELVAFSILPQTFEILVRNMADQMVSVYMHRILTAYSKYFNSKYNKKGHVFAGPFRATQIKAPQVPVWSAMIHSSPKKIEEWKTNYEKYPWSTYSDYLGINRWGELLSVGTIMNRYKDKKLYREFVTAHSTNQKVF